MMGIGHIFTVRARLEQIDRDNRLNLSSFGIDALFAVFPLLDRPGYEQTWPVMLDHARALRLDLCTNNHYFMRWAASHNDLPLLQELHKHGANLAACNGYATRYAAFNGNLDALQWLHSLGLVAPHRDDAITYAAGNGHIAAMDFLESTGPLQTPPEKALFSAAQGAHVPALQWLIDHGVDPLTHHNSLMRHAMHSADVTTLEWAKKQGVFIGTIDEDDQIEAAATGKTEHFDWCLENEIVLDFDIIASAAAIGAHPALLKWAHEHGGIADKRALKHLISRLTRDNDETLQTLIDAQLQASSSIIVKKAITAAITEFQTPSISNRLRGLLKIKDPS